MKTSDELYVTNRDDWREWLRKNYDKEKEVWLIYYKEYTSKPSISYDDSVEEALCFGLSSKAVMDKCNCHIGRLH